MTRFNLHYTMDDSTVDFVLRAVEWVAAHGWKLMPAYNFLASGAWEHAKGTTPVPSLLDLTFGLDGPQSFHSHVRRAPAGHSLDSYFASADAAVAATKERLRHGR